MNYLFLRGMGFICGVFLMLVACASTAPTKFYSLNSLVDTRATHEAVSVDQNTAIGIGPIEIPDYLDRPHIVTRSSQNEFRVSDFDKWAGSLKNNISRVIAENLSVLLSSERIYVYPWKSYTPIEYRIVVDITRFDGLPDGDVLLKVNWSILAGDGKKVLLMKTSSFSEKTEGRGYSALIAAESRALENLSREIASALRLIYK
ncbi:MAG: membrane integrity-associated transporter subunit PqiC [Thermodesulfovibrionia bacterium]|nr:membrane integrity-associated transporter subunit PqiC [Thermodesulfovibrionia bacterium]